MNIPNKELIRYQSEAMIKRAKTTRNVGRGVLYTLATVGACAILSGAYSLGKDIFYDGPRKIRTEADLAIATRNVEAAQEILVGANPRNDMGNISLSDVERLRAMIRSEEKKEAQKRAEPYFD